MKSKLGQRDYAWSYFQLHANQRMSTFNFYIVISALMTTGLISVLTGKTPSPLLGLILGFSLIIVSFVFWKLDQRVSFLIKHAEDTLKKLEQDSENNCSDFYTYLFSEEEMKTSESESNCNPLSMKLTYSKCFSILYLLFGVLGIIGITMSCTFL